MDGWFYALLTAGFSIGWNILVVLPILLLLVLSVFYFGYELICYFFRRIYR